MEATSFDCLMERYHEHYDILNLSAWAWRSQKTYLGQFKQFLLEVGIGDLRAVTGSHLQEFQKWLFYLPTRTGTARKVTTQNRTMETVRALFRFLKQEGYVVFDPTVGIQRAREPQPLPKNVLTPDEAQRIIETPDTTTLIGFRDRTILEVLYATGIRKMELINLNIEDVDVEQGLLRVNGGKGAKDRVVPLSGMACRFLENYVKGVRMRLLKENVSSRVFISLESTPMGRNTVGEMVVKYGKLSGIKKRVTCHLWRHTCATHLIQNRANLRHVQEMLGHRSLATTERYLHLTITDLKEAHRQFHPREQVSF